MKVEDIHIPTILKNLAEKRLVFHFEADLQLTLARYMRKIYPHLKIYLEHPINLSNKKRNCDIVLFRGDRIVMAIELKFFTRKLEYENKGELFTLKQRDARDLGRYGILQDVERMECFLEEEPKAQASVIAVTNDYNYWESSREGKIDEEFDIHQGTILTGVRKWKGSPKSWKKGPVKIRGRYKMEWQKYSEINRKFGLFYYLHIPIERPET